MASEKENIMYAHSYECECGWKKTLTTTRYNDPRMCAVKGHGEQSNGCRLMINYLGTKTFDTANIEE